MLSLLSTCAARSGTSVRAEVRRAYFAVLRMGEERVGRERREPSEQRRALCASLFRGAEAPKSVEKNLLAGLLCLYLWRELCPWCKDFFFSYSGAFLEPLFASIHARNLSFGTTIRLPILSAGKPLLRASS